MKTQITELMPRDSRKSFYRKAFIIKKGPFRALKSYETIVCYRDAAGKLHRTWSGWSATTGRHIASFDGPGKAGWDKMPVEPVPRALQAYNI